MDDTIAQRARDLALHCEAKKHAYRQTQDGVVVSFVLHPHEVPPALTLAQLGTRYMLALVEIGDNEEPKGGDAAAGTGCQTSSVSNHETSPAPIAAQSGRAKVPFDQMIPAQQAGVLCNDPAFVQFLREKRRIVYDGTKGPANEFERAAECVRSLCGVETRKDIQANAASGWHWKSLVEEYRLWQRYPEYA